MDYLSVNNFLKEDMEEVKKELYSNLDSDVELVNEVAGYVLDSGGKRLRPMALILSAGLSGYKGERSAKLGCIVEYIHTATLLHDDIIDGAMVRRGNTSANVKYGSDITVLCGDFLYSKAFINLVKDGNPEIQMILAKAANTMSEGEVFQLVKTADYNLNMEDYIKIIFSKTAVLFSSCCEIGAILGGNNTTVKKKLKEFGKLVGLAFQMNDDILDFLGDQNITGKSTGTDFKEGKMTLPMIMLRENASKEENKIFKELITESNFTLDKLENIIALMQKYDIKTKALNYVFEYVNKAKSILNSINIQHNFDNSNYKKYLEYIAEYSVTRKK